MQHLNFFQSLIEKETEHVGLKLTRYEIKSFIFLHVYIFIASNFHYYIISIPLYPSLSLSRPI